jgi:hypothetical protein
VRLCDSVERLPPVSFIRQKTASLHQTQMLRRHVAGYSARIRELANGISPSNQQLNHPQSMRMRERLETLGGFRESA